MLRAGLKGAFAAWLGFTLPSALALIAFGYGVGHFGGLANAAWLHGLKIVAVAVVAQALWGMSRSLAPDRERASIAVVSALLALALPSALGQIGAIVLGGLVGCFLLSTEVLGASTPLAFRLPRGLSIGALILFFALLFGLPVIAKLSGVHLVRLVDSFYRSGSLVFGGGHVVLPLLQREVVPPGWIGNDAFLAGYGAAQAVPGPLFTFSAYLGTVMSPSPNGWIGGLICLVAIFLPSSSWSRAFCPSGRICAEENRCSPRSKASTPPWSGCFSPRSTHRSGRARSLARRISRWALSPSCCSSSGKFRRGWS
jgi:chromate transporter